MEDITNRLVTGTFEYPLEFSPLNVEYIGREKDIFGGKSLKCYRLTSSTGVELNSVFGKGITFCDNPKSKEMSAAFSTVTFDMKYFFKKGELGAVCLCHEIGHILNPDDLPVLVSPMIDAEQGTDEYYLERFRKFNDEDNKIWRTEVEAWEYGKLVADVLGIHEELYHYRMSLALRTYYVIYTLDKIIHLRKVLKRQLVELDDVIEYYNIWTQEAQIITISELVERTIQQEAKVLQTRDSQEYKNTLEL